MVCHHLTKFGGDSYCGSRDVFLVCPVIYQDHVREAYVLYFLYSTKRKHFKNFEKCFFFHLKTSYFRSLRYSIF